MNIPTSQDYVAAVSNPSRFILDPQLAKGSPKKSRLGGLELYSGGFSRVFPIDIGNKIFALRCWTANVEDAKVRYQEISNYLKYKNLEYFIGFEYVEKGILVNSKEWPIIKMDWVTGSNLKDYVEANLNSPHILRELAETFYRMVVNLHEQGIAHGDLQDGNIIIINSAQIKLIDYDSLFVPSLVGLDDQIVGIPSYQHPLRINQVGGRKMTKKVDYFSELVIYLSLLALADDAALWQEYKLGQAEGLLFSKEDFLNTGQSKIFNKLKNSPNKDIRFFINKLEYFCHQHSIDNLDPLEQVISESKQDKLNNLKKQIPKTPIPVDRPRSQGGIILIIFISLVILGFIGFNFFNGNSVEKQLQEAVEQGNLIKPPGKNAYEYYQRLKREQPNSEVLKNFSAVLLPKIMKLPEQLFSETAKQGSRDIPVSEWQEAQQLMLWASTINPGDSTLAAKADYCAGRVAYLSKNKDEALRLWNQVNQQYKTWALPANGIGIIYNERKDYTSAQKYLFEAINRDPNWALPYNNIGTSFFYQRNYDQAKFYYEQAVKLDQNWARPHAWLGDIARIQKDYSLAVKEYQAAIDLAKPENGLNLEKIRQMLEQAKQMSESDLSTSIQN